MNFYIRRLCNEFNEEKWDEILEHLRIEHNVTDVSFRTWLLPLKVHEVKEHFINISIDDKMIGPDSKNFISRKYGIPLKVSIAEVMNETYDIEFVLESEIKAKEKSSKTSAVSRNSQALASNLNPRYTLIHL